MRKRKCKVCNQAVPVQGCGWCLDCVLMYDLCTHILGKDACTGALRGVKAARAGKVLQMIERAAKQLPLFD